MFWRFGAYASISTFNNLLEKTDVTLEEVLDEADLIQELKQSNSKLLEYLRNEEILKRLLEYAVTSPLPRPEEEDDDDDDDDEESRSDNDSGGAADTGAAKSLSPFRRRTKLERTKQQEELDEWEKQEKTRSKYAYNSCEILASETWSIMESIMADEEALAEFWGFLRREPPLDPTAASYFTKINETLIDKKTEEMMAFLQRLDGMVPAMLKHIDCAAVMDLLLKIISMEKSDGGAGVIDWLQNEGLIPHLLAFLHEEYPAETQTSAGDFMKAVVTISANASQNEQSCIGPNNLTRQLVSQTCMENLLSDMLRGGNPLTVGVGLIIEIIRKNNSDYDPEIGSGPDITPTSSDPIYLGTMLRCFARRVPDFMALLQSPTQSSVNGELRNSPVRTKAGLASGTTPEALGFDRFKTCELMAELLHCSNMGLLNEKGSEEFIRQRDEEREKLRKEGMLQAVRPPDSAVTEFAEDTSFKNDTSANTSDTMRRLAVANSGGSTEDDGFEDVGHPADDADELKDEFDDKTAFDLEAEQSPPPVQPVRPTRPRLDLDDEFVDEPLSSPRGSPSLEALVNEKADDDDGDMPAPLKPKHAPTSPTKEISEKIDDLALDTQQTSSRLQQPSVQSEQTLKTAAAAAAPSAPSDEKSDLIATSPLFSHPEDKPAPLFTSDAQDDAKIPPAADPIEGEASEETDATPAQALDPEGSELQSDAGQNYEVHFEYDIDGQPMVGDFLKIMFVEHKVVPTILNFFFRFPWNNFLHNVVYDVVQQVFNGPMDRGYNRSLAVDLFETGHITERIVDGQMRSDEAQTQVNMRLGYMGHLTLVAEEVVKFSDRHPPEMLGQAVLEAVTAQRWIEYVDSTLAETRERDNAILGGVRPDMSLGPRQAVLNAVNSSFGGGASTALANVGLNGGAAGLDSMDLATNGSATSGGSFTLSSNSLLSGFGSSSDEEDEDLEEMDETTDAMAAATAVGGLGGSSSAGVTSSDTPSVPPPLNLPPSRARNKLAARLARHQQPQQPNSPSSSSPITEDSSRSAGDEDDDDDLISQEQRDAIRSSLEASPTSPNAGMQLWTIDSPVIKDISGPRSGAGDDDDDDEDDEDGDEDEGLTMGHSRSGTSSGNAAVTTITSPTSPSAPTASSVPLTATAHPTQPSQFLAAPSATVGGAGGQLNLDSFANSPAADVDDTNTHATGASPVGLSEEEDEGVDVESGGGSSGAGSTAPTTRDKDKQSAARETTRQAGESVE